MILLYSESYYYSGSFGARAVVYHPALPIDCRMTRHCFHHGKLFLTPCVNDLFEFSSGAAEHLAVFCEVETLLAHCAESAAGRKPTDVLWRTIGRQHNVGFKFFGAFNPCALPRFFISIGGCLVTAKPPPRCAQWQKKSQQFHFRWPHEIFARSHSTESWICVGEMPMSLKQVMAVSIPTSGEVVVINSNGSKVFKVTLTGKIYQPPVSFCI